MSISSRFIDASIMSDEQLDILLNNSFITAIASPASYSKTRLLIPRLLSTATGSNDDPDS